MKFKTHLFIIRCSISLSLLGAKGSYVRVYLPLKKLRNAHAMHPNRCYRGCVHMYVCVQSPPPTKKEMERMKTEGEW